MDFSKLKKDIILNLFDIEAIKFGSFILKSGQESPVYFDLRVIISYPELMKKLADLLWSRISDADCSYSSVCGVPYTALPMATIISIKHNIPMLIRRKEVKAYGTKKMIEGVFKPNDTSLIIEDVVTSGSSVLETVRTLEHVKVQVKDCIVFLDRCQGGEQMLADNGIRLHSVCTIDFVLTTLMEAGKLNRETVDMVKNFVQSNSTYQEDDEKSNLDSSSIKTYTQPLGTPVKSTIHFRLPQMLTYQERAKNCSHPLSKRIFTIMEEKKSNLAFSADIDNSAEFLKIVDEVGSHICILKTHIDIIKDFDSEFIHKLTNLADKHNFLIFEDRKFADIGNTVYQQYSSGIYQILNWAHIVNAHSLPGSGILKGLEEAVKRNNKSFDNRGCLLIGQMSSADNLLTPDYSRSTVEMAEQFPNFVIGFISTHRLTSNPEFIHMTPGVSLNSGSGDGLGQRYCTPENVIRDKGCEIIIVGRSITTAVSPREAARQYQQAGYEAYLSSLEQN